MFIWFSSILFLAHPMNFFQTSTQENSEVDEMEEDEEEDICYIPRLDQEGQESSE